jgi:hypothetical protein
MIIFTYRHPSEGGGPSPDRLVYTRAQVMDSRLRGNDEVWGMGGGFFMPSCLRASCQ